MSATLDPVGAWFYAWPALPGEGSLHRAGGYHVDAEECELHVVAACGLSCTAAVAVHVPSPGPLDSRCRGCRYAERDLRPAMPGGWRPHRRPPGRVKEGSR